MGREMVCSGERPADFVGDERLDFVVLLVHVTNFIDATARCSEDFDRQPCPGRPWPHGWQNF